MKIRSKNLGVSVSLLFVVLFLTSASVLYADDYGACCIHLDTDDISCIITTPENCVAQMGWTKFQGFDSDCLDGTCIPDCGDIDFSGNVDILDVLYSISLIYKCGPDPWMYEVADVDGSGTVNILDAIYLINSIYKGGPNPICPGLQLERDSYKISVPTRDCK